jgi:hypothetical protein
MCSESPERMSVYQPLWYLLTPFSYFSTYFTSENDRNTEGVPDDPEPADERDIQMEYFSD